MTIYSTIKDELDSRRVLVPNTLLQRISSSIGGHILNLANIDHKFSTPHGIPENYRNQLVFMAPSGFGKSVTFRSLLRPGDGVLGSLTCFNTAVRSTFSVEAWMGTAVKGKDGDIQETGGVFTRYKRGIVGADEYQSLRFIFEGQGLGHDEVYLMTALDTDTATKDISYKNIEISGIGFTMWAGMRPTNINLVSGAGRRFTFELFFPSRKVALDYKKAARECDKGSTAYAQPQVLENAVTGQMSDIVTMGPKNIDYSEVDLFLDQFDIPHFEENIFRRLALGLSVARGEYPDVVLTPEMECILESEYMNRGLLRNSIADYMMYSILRDEPDKEIDLSALMHFLNRYYQMSTLEAKEFVGQAKFNGTISLVDKIPKGKQVVLSKGVGE